MSVSIDITGLPHERVTAAPSPLAELGMALHAMAEPGHHPGLQGWAAATAASLDPCLADRLCEADFLWRTSFSDVFMPFAGQPGAAELPAGTLAGELDQLDRITDRQFVDAALEFTCDITYGTDGTPDPLTDPASRRRALELAAARGPRQVTFTQRLLDDPPVVRAWFRRLVEDCAEAFFGDTWARLRLELAADARHKNELLRHKGLREALADASRAIAYDETAALITIDKLSDGRTATGTGGGRLTLVPTSLGRPHVMVLHRQGWQPVIHYPLAAGGLNASSVQDLTRRIEALAHPVRIRLCRHLARGSYTTGELADAHGMTAPEISRHLAVLKKAGLLSTQRRGRYVLHQLDLAKVVRLGSDFVEGVLR
ncbi:DUF5937 family protein [Streptomyces sp. NPDC002851]